MDCFPVADREAAVPPGEALGMAGPGFSSSAGFCEAQRQPKDRIDRERRGVGGFPNHVCLRLSAVEWELGEGTADERR